MATKAITLELDSSEKLRRAQYSNESITAGDLLARLMRRMETRENIIDEETLDRLTQAQCNPRVSESACG